MEETLQGGSNVNPLALAVLILMAMILLGGSRQMAVGAILLTAAIIPLGQQVVIAGLHFHFLRILLIVGYCRVLAQHEALGFTLNLLDKLFLYWALAGLICGSLRGPSAAVFGMTYNSLGTYFLVRFLMKKPEDLIVHLRVLAIGVLAISACMVWESVSHRNPFYVFGGVPEVPMDRGDRMRCQGPFRIPILAGTFSATLFPMMAGLWLLGGRNKRHGTLGMLGSLIATVLSNSSGPLMCLIAAVIGLSLWRVRERMRLFRRLTVAVIIGLSFVMKAPVWYLIQHVSDLVGGGGWHRAYVIDVAVKHFDEWWLVGTGRTADWAPGGQVLLVDPDNMDITNHYVAQGVMGGIWMLGLFMACVVFSFKIIGRDLTSDSKGGLEPKFLWCIGTALASHCTAFISISYFDQISVFWFWQLAIISSLMTFRSSQTGAENHLTCSAPAPSLRSDDITSLGAKA